MVTPYGASVKSCIPALGWYLFCDWRGIEQLGKLKTQMVEQHASVHNDESETDSHFRLAAVGKGNARQIATARKAEKKQVEKNTMQSEPS